MLATIGGNHPSAKVELVAKSLQWRDQVKYLGCMLRWKSCDIDTHSLTSSPLRILLIYLIILLKNCFGKNMSKSHISSG